MLRFYTIDENYINYLKQYDEQIPTFTYQTHSKFLIGIVLDVNGVEYYAPISSFNRKQKTNFPIIHKNKIISSVRLCFMFPAKREVLHQMNFKEIKIKDPHYADLLSTEYRYCASREKELLSKALFIYKIGTSISHPLKYTCCDFGKLEKVYSNYNKNIDYSTYKITDDI